MRLLILLALMSVTLIVWFVRDRRQECERRHKDSELRLERQARLDEAAVAVETQAEFGREVANRIRESNIEIPDELRESVDAVVIELDGVAHDLRTCTYAPVHHRRTLLHR